MKQFHQPVMIGPDGSREFICSPTAVLGVIFRSDEQVLLFSKGPGRWRVISGAVEREENIRDAAVREVAEEAGPDVKVRPLGAIHAFRYAHNPSVIPLVCIPYLLEYQSGEVVPGDDMAGAELGWYSVDQIEQMHISVPDGQRWLFRRALHLYRALRDADDVDLEPMF